MCFWQFILFLDNGNIVGLYEWLIWNLIFFLNKTKKQRKMENKYLSLKTFLISKNHPLFDPIGSQYINKC